MMASAPGDFQTRIGDEEGRSPRHGHHLAHGLEVGGVPNAHDGQICQVLPGHGQFVMALADELCDRKLVREKKARDQF